MIAEKMKPYLQNNSAIRAMFEEGKKMAEQYGADKVYDFSLGNPNVPAPEKIKEAIKEILDEEDPVFVHGYMSNAGFPHVLVSEQQANGIPYRHCGDDEADDQAGKTQPEQNFQPGIVGMFQGTAKVVRQGGTDGIGPPDHNRRGFLQSQECR